MIGRAGRFAVQFQSYDKQWRYHKALTLLGTYNMHSRLGLPCCRQLGNHFSKCNENSCQNSNSHILFVALGGFAVVSERKVHAFEQGGGNLAIVANVTVEEEIYDSAENRSASSWRGQ